MPVRYSKQIQKTGAAIGTVVSIVRPSTYTTSTVESTEASNWNIDSIYPGWLECDGRTLNVSDYGALYNVIGNTYGGTTGTTFKLPDYRSKKICGTGSLNSQSGSSLSLPVSLGPSGSPGGSAVTAGSVGGLYTLSTVRQLPSGSEITPGTPSSPSSIGGNAIDTFSLGTFRSSGFSGVTETRDVVLSGDVTWGVGPTSEVTVSAVPPHFHFLESCAAGTQKATLGDPQLGAEYNFKEDAEGTIRGFNRALRQWPGSQPAAGGLGVAYEPSQLGSALSLSGTCIRAFGPGSGEVDGFASYGSSSTNQYLAFGGCPGGIQTTRIATWTVDGTLAESFVIFAIAGNDSNGGERVNNAGEGLKLYFNGVYQDLVVPARGDYPGDLNSYDQEYQNWKSRTYTIPASYRSSSLQITLRQDLVAYSGEQGVSGPASAYDMIGVGYLSLSGAGTEYEYPGDNTPYDIQRHSHMIYWDEANSGDSVPSTVSTFGTGGGTNLNYGGVVNNGLRSGISATTVISTNNSIGPSLTKTITITNDLGMGVRPATITMTDASRVAFDNAISVRLEAAEEITLLTSYFRTKYIIKAY